MIREKFEEIANQLECEYSYSEKRHASFVSRNIPVSYHTINLEYSSVHIKLVYEFGGHNLGKINSVIKTNKGIPDFSVTTKSQTQRLFSKDKRPFRLECVDELFESKIKRILDSSGYIDLAQRTTFEPEIRGENKDGSFILSTTFYLGFEDKELSILPSIELHKKLIDEILR